MKKKTPILALIASLSSVLLPNVSHALDEYPYIAERLPPHLQVRAQLQAASIGQGAIANIDQYYISTLKTWDTSKAIKVCFFDGSPSLRKRIAVVANRWAEIENTGLKFDFGNIESTYICGEGNTRFDIRIGFGYKGYWSTVGTDSVNLAAQTEQSMNLALFNVNPPPEPEFSRVVLHEFGHAIGLKHDHQIPDSSCPMEFDWDRINHYLKGPPNYWSQQTINDNMKPISTSDRTSDSDFDKHSIMLYSFPRDFYKVRNPKCYTPGNTRLSRGDKLVVQNYYPGNRAVASTQRDKAFAQYRSFIQNASIPDADKQLFAKNLDDVFELKNLESVIASSSQALPRVEFNYENRIKSPDLQNIETGGSININIQ